MRAGIGGRKRGGAWDKVEFDEALVPAASRNLDVIALDDALQDLTKLNPQHCRIVELRFFGGLTTEEVARFSTSPRERWSANGEWRGPGCVVRFFGENQDVASR